MYIQQEKKVELCKKNMLNLIRESQVEVVSTEVRPRLSNSTHCLDLGINGKIPGITSDGSFSSYLIGRS